jgi:hypothetical protein
VALCGRCQVNGCGGLVEPGDFLSLYVAKSGGRGCYLSSGCAAPKELPWRLDALKLYLSVGRRPSWRRHGGVPLGIFLVAWLVQGLSRSDLGRERLSAGERTQDTGLAAPMPFHSLVDQSALDQLRHMGIH